MRIPACSDKMKSVLVRSTNKTRCQNWRTLKPRKGQTARKDFSEGIKCEIKNENKWKIRAWRLQWLFKRIPPVCAFFAQVHVRCTSCHFYIPKTWPLSNTFFCMVLDAINKHKFWYFNFSKFQLFLWIFCLASSRKNSTMNQWNYFQIKLINVPSWGTEIFQFKKSEITSMFRGIVNTIFFLLILEFRYNCAYSETLETPSPIT